VGRGYFLIVFGVCLAAIALLVFLDPVVAPTAHPAAIALVAGFVIATGWMATATYIRRMHDQDRSGWYALLLYAGPLVGVMIDGLRPLDQVTPLVAIGMALLPGSIGPNRFGPAHRSTPPS